jgi:hypothetical protein
MKTLTQHLAAFLKTDEGVEIYKSIEEDFYRLGTVIYKDEHRSSTSAAKRAFIHKHYTFSCTYRNCIPNIFV